MQQTQAIVSDKFMNDLYEAFKREYVTPLLGLPHPPLDTPEVYRRQGVGDVMRWVMAYYRDLEGRNFVPVQRPAESASESQAAPGT